jgi:ElaB protein
MNTTTTPQTHNGNLASSVRHMVDEADQFLQAAAQSGDAKFDAMRDSFVRQVRQLRAQLDELEDGAIHKVRHAARNADLAVQTHPYSAMGFAAAAGLAIGLLIGRR